jgi:hypothetical protein
MLPHNLREEHIPIVEYENTLSEDPKQVLPELITPLKYNSYYHCVDYCKASIGR